VDKSVFSLQFFNRGKTEVPCDSGAYHPGNNPEHFRLEYHLYQMFLDEGNLDEDELFKGLEMMAYPAMIKTNGNKVIADSIFFVLCRVVVYVKHNWIKPDENAHVACVALAV
jgi:hypothetical protein